MSDPVCHRVEFRPSGRGKAKCPPNPEYPNGIAVDPTKPGQKSCLVTLPYPAPECGCWIIHCAECHIGIVVTAAGRVDDPISVKVPCQQLQMERPDAPSIGGKR